MQFDSAATTAVVSCYCTVPAASTFKPNPEPLTTKSISLCNCVCALVVSSLLYITSDRPFDSFLSLRAQQSLGSFSHPSPSIQAADNVPLNGPPSYVLPRQLTSSLYPPGFTTVLPSVCSPAASRARPHSGHTAHNLQGKNEEQKRWGNVN